jgi:glycosyltransferase involved in cell wall biosynthesis
MSESVDHPFFDEKNQVIIGVGRLTRAKRFDRLIRVFKSVHEALPQARLIIVGDAEKRQELQALIDDLKLNDHVQIVGFKKNPYAWISKADVFVLSSDYEGFPNSVLESMACGTPVVSVDCPFGPSEIIENGIDAELVPLDDDKALAERIRALLTDKARSSRFSENAIQKVKNYSLDRIIPQYEKLFDEVIYGKN